MSHELPQPPPPHQHQHQHQLSFLVGGVNLSTTNGPLVAPFDDKEVAQSWNRNVGVLFFDNAIQNTLRFLIDEGIPIAASNVINDLDVPLGGDLPPTNESWPDAHKWAVTLIVISSIICLAVVALVIGCIIFERCRTTQAKTDANNGSHSSADGDAHTHSYRGRAVTPSAYSSDTSEEDDAHSFYFDGYDESEERRVGSGRREMEEEGGGGEGAKHHSHFV
ncbi:hypothetical protein JKF63_06317 [Porcisia hertigi]|uniref:Uncharacterized protein n=1 Tax=Porcisia hertigi TaxID=2761500 RepID=A0A836INK6_9TRYP|nr:hypothetical protein JKF63_06317 [Porcisia hertigi]